MMLVVNGGEIQYYYQFDGLGSVVALSNVNGEIVERYSYDVFGKPTIRNSLGQVIGASAFGNRFMFTGREYDNEALIGLYYYRARYYKPSIGRFLQPDPIGYYGGLNLYTYCGNNPIVLVDPFGRDYYDLNITYTPAGTVVGGAAGAISSGGWGLVGGVLSGSLSPTGGVMFDKDSMKIYPYVGLASSTNPFPKLDVSLAQSNQNPSTGVNVAVTASAFVTGQAGYGFGEDGGVYFENGGSNAVGGSASAFYALGPYDVKPVVDTYKKVVNSMQTISNWFSRSPKRASSERYLKCGKK